MSLRKYSNLELLKEVYRNLAKDDESIDELCERELVALIKPFYQGQEVPAVGEKRKNEDSIPGEDSKKLRLLHQVSADSSPLELLPNKLFGMILENLSGNDLKNIRITSKGLYDKTNLMAPMFEDWGFADNRGTQPDFILENEKNFRIRHLKRRSENGPSQNLTKYANRITSLQTDLEGALLSYLKVCPAKFSKLTSLELENVEFDNDSLLMLAPQLQNLGLSNIKQEHEYFDLESVDEGCESFTKLKTLTLKDVEIDLVKILTKSNNTLEYLELKFPGLPANLGQEFSSLRTLNLYLDASNSGHSVRNLLTKCCGSLITLIIHSPYHAKLDYSSLLQHPIGITTLEINAHKKSDIETFLSKCPMVQTLILRNYFGELNTLFIKDLINLNLRWCGPKCMTSALKQASTVKLKTFQFRHSALKFNLAEIDFPVIPEIDTVMIVDTTLNSVEFDQVLKLFPRNAKVTTTEETKKTEFRNGFVKFYHNTVLRRVYHLS